MKAIRDTIEVLESSINFDYLHDLALCQMKLECITSIHLFHIWRIDVLFGGVSSMRRRAVKKITITITTRY